MLFKCLIPYLFFQVMFLGFSQSEKTDTHYFILDKEITAFKKTKDTLYEFKCYPNFECSDYRKKYKIINRICENNKEVFAIEKLQSNPYKTDPLPDKRYSILGIEDFKDGRIKIVHEVTKYTLDSISKIPLSLDLFDKKFGFTFYSQAFLEGLETDYSFTRGEVEAIVENIKQSAEKSRELYLATKTGDIYAGGLTGEYIAVKLIKRNLSPINALSRMDEAMKE